MREQWRAGHAADYDDDATIAPPFQHVYQAQQQQAAVAVLLAVAPCCLLGSTHRLSQITDMLPAGSGVSVVDTKLRVQASAAADCSAMAVVQGAIAIAGQQCQLTGIMLMYVVT